VRARLLLTRTLASAGLLAALSASAAHAQSQAARLAGTEIFRDYVGDGRIDPCDHSSQELQLARASIPPDVEQYAADYPAAIKTALEARARGDCSPGGEPAAAPAVPAATAAPAATATPTAAAGAPTAATPAQSTLAEPPAPESAGSAAGAAADVAVERVAAASPGGDAPAPVLLLGILAALLALTALLLAAMRRLGVGDERLAGAAHAWREARWRAGGTWEGFRDWLRLGR
jgi:cobalamin biosynthesis Mg chelatase CobN